MKVQHMSKIIQAAERMDWVQVVLNGGPPCFHLEDGRFCGRAERWGGHGEKDFHDFVPLHQLLTTQAEEIERLHSVATDLRDAATTLIRHKNNKDESLWSNLANAANRVSATLGSPGR